jgi:Leucine-rich repeat (LRR) protein
MLKNQSWIIISLLGLCLQTQAQTDCAAVTEIPTTECQALIALYNSTDGANWWDNTGWNVTNSPCSWYGIVCNNAYTNVRSIVLLNNRLSGYIPADIGNLSKLANLKLNSNQLSGTIPANIGNLSKLTTLDLSSNQLSGTIPTELDNLNKLEYLSLAYNQLSGTIPTQLGNLEWLDLSYNQLSSPIPADIGNLNNLEYLSLAYNQLSDSIPAALGNLSQLEYLYLGGNQLSGFIPASLGSLSNLKELRLSDNLLSGTIPPSLGSLSNLEDLRLAINQLSGTIPPSLGNLINLKILRLSTNQLSGSIPSELGDLINLEDLKLQYNELCGNIPPSFMNLVKIESLNLKYNHLTASDPALIAWLDIHNNGWDTDQTACPSDILPIGGAAIIIAGGGSDDSNTLWDTTAAISNYIYKMLYTRGFKHDEIYYLSPQSYADFNGDGLDDGIVDIPTTPRALKVEDVRQALTWAKTQGQLKQPLYVFFINHGGKDRFLIAKNSYLDVQDFKAMLDDYQNETGNQLALLIDACYSGILLEKLIAQNRAIISSTGDGLAYFDRTSKQGFSRFFASGLLKGMNFYEAFDYARDKQTKLVKSFSIGDDQNPQWYDGTTDGQWLQDIFINGNFTVADITLTVSAITPSNQELSADSTLPLIAQVTLSEGTIEQVWAVLKPPKVNLVMDSYGTPILSFPRLNLSRTQEENVWASTWGDAVYNGEYEIIFYAQDNQGNIAGSDPITINVIGGVESPEASSVQIDLEKDSYNPGEHFQARLTEELAWGYDLYAAVVMPDGNFFALKNTNEIAAINSVAKWDKQRIPHSPVMLLDLTLPENLPSGEYCLYGILSPENESVLETLDLWVWTQRCFEVN